MGSRYKGRGEHSFRSGGNGRSGKIVCNKCLEDKPKSEVEQVKNSFGYTVNMCEDCRGDDNAY